MKKITMKYKINIATRYVLTLIAMLTLSPAARAQQETQLTGPANFEYMPSAQVWGFMRYGNHPVDHYTGTARVNIPIYTYKDKDFEIPIGIGYASGGFIPARQTGILGLNWFLNAGGSITREIRGTPDDFMGNQENNHWVPDGFLLRDVTYSDELLQNFAPANSFVNSYIYGANAGEGAPVRETESDIYHFNFMGYSGTFHYGGDGKPRVYNTNGNHGLFKIEQHLTGIGESYIIITTGDGFKYTFGGEEEFLERKMATTCVGGPNIHPGFNFHFQLSPIITWHLREIEAPNKRKVTFEYENGHLPLSFLGTDRQERNENLIVTYHRKLWDKDLFDDEAYRYSRIWSTTSEAISIIKTTYLKSISINNGLCRIDLTYSRKEAVEDGSSPDGYSSSFIQPLKKLDKIEIYDAAKNSIRNCILQYRAVDKCRNLLDKFTISGEGDYTLSYYNDKPLPSLRNNGIDFWGYYNGRDDINKKFPDVDIDSALEEKIVSGIKNPHSGYSILGNLKRITYPTKGYTDFEYESHTASAIVSRGATTPSYASAPLESSTFLKDNTLIPLDPYSQELFSYSGNPWIPHLKNYTTLVGGVRVSKITDFDSKGNQTTRKFKYYKGNVLTFPRYALRTSRTQGTGHIVTTLFASVFYPTTPCTFDKTHIEYGLVEEELADNSKIRYHFNTYRTHPDIYDDQKSTLQLPVFPEIESIYSAQEEELLNQLSRKPSSRHNERGKLNCVEYLDANNNLVQKEVYASSLHNANEEVNYTTFVSGSHLNLYAAKLFTGDYRMSSKTVNNYYGTDSVTVETNYSYNGYGQLSRTSTTNGDGKIYGKNTTYISDLEAPPRLPGGGIITLPLLPAANSDNFWILQERNLLQYPDTETSTIDINGRSHYLGVTRHHYGVSNQSDNLVNLIELRKETFPNPTFLYNTANVPLETSYDKHDQWGNILQATGRDGMPVTYLWGYNRQYIIAVIKNATHAQVAGALPQGVVERLAASLAPSVSDMQLVDSLRGNSGLNAAMISTFTYQPMVGVTSITDPSGRKTNYEYDSFGRLERTTDLNGSLLEEYQYHYKN